MPTRAQLIPATLLAAMGPFLQGCATTGDSNVQRETIEWCHIWVTNADKDDLPRVLLVGDSITRAYFKGVEERLAGKANCAVLATSKCIGDPGLLPELQLMLDQYRFDVIHVNNGMHGWSYSDERYNQAFEPFMEALMRRAPQARFIWAHTTPVMKESQPDQKLTERVKARNRTAETFAERNGIPVNDLFALVVSHPEYFSADGVHLNKQGIDVQAGHVAEHVLKALEEAQ